MSPRSRRSSPRFGALLTPQGKIIVDCIIAEGAGRGRRRLLPRCARARSRATFVQKLNFYKLRAKVDLRGPLARCSASWRSGTARATPTTAWSMPTRACRRSASASCCRRISPRRPRPISARELVEAQAYEAHRIALGVPRGGLDFVYGDAFPHETDMDQLGRRRFRQGLLCRPGGGVAHGASRHGAQRGSCRLRRKLCCPTPACR